MLRADHIDLSLGGRPILRGASLTVQPGRMVALVGPNGAGKSSLLKVMSGHWRADRGVVSVDGRALAQWTPAELGKRRALLPQESHLNFAFPVIEVVLMGRSPHNRHGERPDDVRIAEAALREVDMEAYRYTPYTELSGGEKQRVDLARVIAQIWEAPPQGSRILLLDEPTNNLDLAHQHRTLATARRFAREGAAVGVVVHDLNLAMGYADDVAVMDGGRVREAGPIERVLKPALIAEVFGVRAEHTCIPGYPRPLIAVLPG